LAGANSNNNPSAAAATNSLTEAAPDPSITQPVPGYVSPLNQQLIQAAVAPPSASPMSSAFQQSSDDSSDATPSVADSVMISIRAVPGEIKDGLDNIMSDVSSVKTSLTNLWNDPSVQFMNQIRSGDYTTAPLPNATDTSDQALNKTFGQAVVGFGDFKDGPHGIETYNDKMLNQMDATLGLAQAQMTRGDPQ
jgi:hypothetical protein